ncbi:MAG TPA: YceI family protein [Flavobacteriaceae bacterium]|nr:YceI family protein [Flavobacteriaceae bacterium]
MKINSIITLLILSISLISCNTKGNNDKDNNKKQYSAEAKTTTINWTAYKTTSKVPVKGQFTKVKFIHIPEGASPREALNGLKFSIPVSSIFTKDSIRDGKLKKFLFGTMQETEFIKGELKMVYENAGSVDITMNGITQTIPITYIISDQMATIEAVLDLDNWKAEAAIEALNVACKQLHSGADGIPKTWTDVKIEVATYLNYE